MQFNYTKRKMEKPPERLKLQITSDIEGIKDLRVIDPPLETRGDYSTRVFLVYNRNIKKSMQEAKMDYEGDNNNERDLRANGLVLATGSGAAELTWGFICDDFGHERRFVYHKIYDESFIPQKRSPLEVIRNLEYVLCESGPRR